MQNVYSGEFHPGKADVDDSFGIGLLDAQHHCGTDRPGHQRGNRWERRHFRPIHLRRKQTVDGNTFPAQSRTLKTISPT